MSNHPFSLSLRIAAFALSLATLGACAARSSTSTFWGYSQPAAPSSDYAFWGYVPPAAPADQPTFWGYVATPSDDTRPTFWGYVPPAQPEAPVTAIR